MPTKREIQIAQDKAKKELQKRKNQIKVAHAQFQVGFQSGAQRVSTSAMTRLLLIVDAWARLNATFAFAVQDGKLDMEPLGAVVPGGGALARLGLRYPSLTQKNFDTLNKYWESEEAREFRFHNLHSMEPIIRAYHVANTLKKKMMDPMDTGIVIEENVIVKGSKSLDVLKPVWATLKASELGFKAGRRAVQIKANIENMEIGFRDGSLLELIQDTYADTDGAMDWAKDNASLFIDMPLAIALDLGNPLYAVIGMGANAHKFYTMAAATREIKNAKTTKDAMRHIIMNWENAPIPLPVAEVAADLVRTGRSEEAMAMLYSTGARPKGPMSEILDARPKWLRRAGHPSSAEGMNIVIEQKDRLRLLDELNLEGMALDKKMSKALDKLDADGLLEWGAIIENPKALNQIVEAVSEGKQTIPRKEVWDAVVTYLNHDGVDWVRRNEAWGSRLLTRLNKADEILRNNVEEFQNLPAGSLMRVQPTEGILTAITREEADLAVQNRIIKTFERQEDVLRQGIKDAATLEAEGITKGTSKAIKALRKDTRRFIAGHVKIARNAKVIMIKANAKRKAADDKLQRTFKFFGVELKDVNVAGKKKDIRAVTRTRKAEIKRIKKDLAAAEKEFKIASKQEETARKELQKLGHIKKVGDKIPPVPAEIPVTKMSDARREALAEKSKIIQRIDKLKELSRIDGEIFDIPSGLFRPSLASARDPKTGQIFLNPQAVKDTFEAKAWSKPKIKGVAPMAENAFKTIEEWQDFLLAHEHFHGQEPFKNLPFKEVEQAINSEVMSMTKFARRDLAKTVKFREDYALTTESNQRVVRAIAGQRHGRFIRLIQEDAITKPVRPVTIAGRKFLPSPTKDFTSSGKEVLFDTVTGRVVKMDPETAEKIFRQLRDAPPYMRIHSFKLNEEMIKGTKKASQVNTVKRVGRFNAKRTDVEALLFEDLVEQIGSEEAARVMQDQMRKITMRVGLEVSEASFDKFLQGIRDSKKVIQDMPDELFGFNIVRGIKVGSKKQAIRQFEQMEEFAIEASKINGKYSAVEGSNVIRGYDTYMQSQKQVWLFGTPAFFMMNKVDNELKNRLKFGRKVLQEYTPNNNPVWDQAPKLDFMKGSNNISGVDKSARFRVPFTDIEVPSLLEAIPPVEKEVSYLIDLIERTRQVAGEIEYHRTADGLITQFKKMGKVINKEEIHKISLAKAINTVEKIQFVSNDLSTAGRWGERYWPFGVSFGLQNARFWISTAAEYPRTSVAVMRLRRHFHENSMDGRGRIGIPGTDIWMSPDSFLATNRVFRAMEGTLDPLTLNEDETAMMNAYNVFESAGNAFMGGRTPTHVKFLQNFLSGQALKINKTQEYETRAAARDTLSSADALLSPLQDYTMLLTGENLDAVFLEKSGIDPKIAERWRDWQIKYEMKVANLNNESIDKIEAIERAHERYRTRAFFRMFGMDAVLDPNQRYAKFDRLRNTYIATSSAHERLAIFIGNTDESGQPLLRGVVPPIESPNKFYKEWEKMEHIGDPVERLRVLRNMSQATQKGLMEGLPTAMFGPDGIVTNAYRILADKVASGDAAEPSEFLESGILPETITGFTAENFPGLDPSVFMPPTKKQIDQGIAWGNRISKGNGIIVTGSIPTAPAPGEPVVLSTGPSAGSDVPSIQDQIANQKTPEQIQAALGSGSGATKFDKFIATLKPSSFRKTSVPGVFEAKKRVKGKHSIVVTAVKTSPSGPLIVTDARTLDPSGDVLVDTPQTRTAINLASPGVNLIIPVPTATRSEFLWVRDEKSLPQDSKEFDALKAEIAQKEKIDPKYAQNKRDLQAALGRMYKSWKVEFDAIKGSPERYDAWIKGGEVLDKATGLTLDYSYLTEQITDPLNGNTQARILHSYDLSNTTVLDRTFMSLTEKKIQSTLKSGVAPGDVLATLRQRKFERSANLTRWRRMMNNSINDPRAMHPQDTANIILRESAGIEGNIFKQFYDAGEYDLLLEFSLAMKDESTRVVRQMIYQPTVDGKEIFNERGVDFALAQGYETEVKMLAINDTLIKRDMVSRGESLDIRDFGAPSFLGFLDAIGVDTDDKEEFKKFGATIKFRGRDNYDWDDGELVFSQSEQALLGEADLPREGKPLSTKTLRVLNTIHDIPGEKVNASDFQLDPAPLGGFNNTRQFIQYSVQQTTRKNRQIKLAFRQVEESHTPPPGESPDQRESRMVAAELRAPQHNVANTALRYLPSLSPTQAARGAAGIMTVLAQTGAIGQGELRVINRGIAQASFNDVAIGAAEGALALAGNTMAGLGQAGRLQKLAGMKAAGEISGFSMGLAKYGGPIGSLLSLGGGFALAEGQEDLGQGLSIAGGALQGAAFGTQILPGIGTAVGAVLGAALGAATSGVFSGDGSNRDQEFRDIQAERDRARAVREEEQRARRDASIAQTRARQLSQPSTRRQFGPDDRVRRLTRFFRRPTFASNQGLVVATERQASQKFRPRF